MSIYRITMSNGRTLRTTTRDLRGAAWTAIANQDYREITTEDDAYGRTAEPGRLCVHCPAPDSGDWSGYETDSLRVRNEHGRVETIPFSAASIWSEDGRDSYYVGSEEAKVRDDWDAGVRVSDLLDAAGLYVSESDVDYRALAEEFVSAHSDARYYLDEERGFANEWTLYVRSGAEEQDDDDLREITPEEAVQYLADAVMDRRDYESIHGCEPYVTAVMD